jgi:tRNA(Leu) C34 or U34 (ribose-2'-O)-methylase TrmL
MTTLLSDFEIKDDIFSRKDEAFLNENDTPALILCNPKYSHNVGAAIRACSCFGAKTVFFTGDRILFDPSKNKGKYRLPREERMKGYKDVKIIKDDYPFNRFENIVPVAVEVRDNSEPLPLFKHPENAVYIFGPEDGSIPNVYLQHCHRFIVIPSKHCLNLAAAVYVILYDRIIKQGVTIREDIELL